MPAGSQRQRVQRAALPAGEARAVVEDARAVDLAGTPPVLLLADRVAHADPLAVGHRGVLPGGRIQLPGGLVHPLLIRGVGEECPVTATADIRIAVDAVATTAE